MSDAVFGATMGPPESYSASPNGNGNVLLASLPATDLELMSRYLETVPLEANATIYDPDVAIEHVYFPESGLVSLLAVLTDGTGVETAIIGRDGMVGMPVFHGTDRIAEQAVVQLSGSARRMTADSFRLCVAQSEALRLALHHYAASVLMFTAQSVACMNKHDTTTRLARWLLHAADHSGTSNVTLTQLFLSHMLGVRRASVTVAASELREAGLITYTRKRIGIIDRAGLERRSCECYGIVRSTYDRLMRGVATTNPLTNVESSREGVSILGSPHGNGDPEES